MAMLLPDVQTTEEKEDTSKRNRRAYFVAKRVLDVVLASVGLVISLIPMACIAFMVRLESPGPAIYIHNRIGKNGKPIGLLKFRSMFLNAEDMIESFTPEQRAEWEANFKLENDPRITRIGKFLRRSSLDELPQLVNIIRGDLSIVGPRPVVMKELERYGTNKDKFLSVIPGLTGYWQAYARSDCSYEQRMEICPVYGDQHELYGRLRGRAC